MASIISHFFNEEFLLPFWLDHHLRIFDHGIMIDYDSTDRSTEIIKSLAPHWQIVQSRNKAFDYIEIDKEVMDIESSIPGWKMCLNTTEFLVHPNLAGYISESEKRNIRGVRTTGIMMVDPLQISKERITQDSPLLMQRHYGYLEKDHPMYRGRVSRSRLLHREVHGNYKAGRHATLLPNIETDDGLFLCWYGFSPYSQIVDRRLQIQSKIPKEHFEKGYGTQHQLTEKELYQKYIEVEPLSKDLWQSLPLLKNYTDAIYG